MLSKEVTSEAQRDLETLSSLFKKYQVCISGTIEEVVKKEMNNI